MTDNCSANGSAAASRRADTDPARPPKRGRPPVLDDVKRNSICALIAYGMSLRAAARYVGCHPSTIRSEARRNQAFREELDRYRMRTQLNPLQAIQAAAKNNWRAAAWMLERLHPSEFTQPTRNSLTQPDARKFVNGLVSLIDRVVRDPIDRQRLHERISPLMPGPLRGPWDERQSRRKLKQAKKYFNKDQPIFDAEDLLAREGM